MSKLQLDVKLDKTARKTWMVGYDGSGPANDAVYAASSLMHECVCPSRRPMDARPSTAARATH